MNEPTLEKRILDLEAAVIAFGDSMGHPFRGNQHTGGRGGEDNYRSSHSGDPHRAEKYYESHSGDPHRGEKAAESGGIVHVRSMKDEEASLTPPQRDAHIRAEEASSAYGKTAWSERTDGTTERQSSAHSNAQKTADAEEPVTVHHEGIVSKVLHGLRDMAEAPRMRGGDIASVLADATETE